MPVLLLLFFTGWAASAASSVEILRDRFGTPNLFANTAVEAAYGAGYAQAEDRGDALLRNLNSSPAEDTALSPQMRSMVEAFCAGINRYFLDHPSSTNTPVTPGMVVAYSRRAFATIHGSNDVLIGPSRGSSGKVIAILDPLNDWNDDARLYEMRWYVSDGGIRLSGVAPLGIPFPVIGHSGLVAIGWTGSTQTAGPRALEQAWAMMTAGNLAGVKDALRMDQIPGATLVGTAQGDIFDSSGNMPDRGILLRERSVAASEEGVRKLLAAQSSWPFQLVVGIAFSTTVYKAETWQARLSKVAPELPLVRMLTGWDRRDNATSTEALAFYLFKMALGPPESAAFEPPESLSNNKIRAALRKAQDQVETELPYRADFGTMFRVARNGALQSTPVGGGTLIEAGMITPRTISFDRRGLVHIGIGGQTATQIVEFSNPVKSVSVLVPGESDRMDAGHFDDQARELFSKEAAKPTYFGDRKELEKHLATQDARKELIF